MSSFAPNAYGHDASQTYARGCASSAHAYVGAMCAYIDAKDVTHSDSQFLIKSVNC